MNQMSKHSKRLLNNQEYCTQLLWYVSGTITSPVLKPFQYNLNMSSLPTQNDVVNQLFELLIPSIPWGNIGDWAIYSDDFFEEGDARSWEDSWDNREHMWTDKEGFKEPKDHVGELAKAL